MASRGTPGESGDHALHIEDHRPATSHDGAGVFRAWVNREPDIMISDLATGAFAFGLVFIALLFTL